MDADFSIELGLDDFVLDFPWSDSAGKLAYVNLKQHPEFLSRIEEARRYPALADFLRAMNSARSIFATAKCDVWTTTELSAEEDIYAAFHKFASYTDLVFAEGETAADRRQSLSVHEQFARKLASLLHRSPELPASVEVCVRRCFFEAVGKPLEGFYFTIYVNGYGEIEATARRNWEIAIKLTGNAILQLTQQTK